MARTHRSRRTSLARSVLRALALPLVAPALALAIAACGGDEAADGAAGATATVAPTREAGTATATPTAAGAATPAASGGSEGLDELTAMLGRAQDAEYRVAYDISAGAQGQTIDGTATWYKSGERFRSDLEFEQAGTKLKVITITTDEASYLCSNLEGTDSCMEFPAGETGGAFANPLEPVALQLEALSDADTGFTVTKADDRTVAGEDATCFDFDSSAAATAGQGTVCLSEEGVLLSMELNGAGGTTKLEATEFSRDVPDESFEPPFPVSG